MTEKDDYQNEVRTGNGSDRFAAGDTDNLLLMVEDNSLRSYPVTTVPGSDLVAF